MNKSVFAVEIFDRTPIISYICNLQKASPRHTGKAFAPTPFIITLIYNEYTMKKLLTLLLTSLIGLQLSALPADPKPRTVTLPDGSRLTIRLVGDEYHHFYLSVDSIPLVVRDGYFYYATSVDGQWQASALRAAEPELRTAADRAYIRQMDRTAMLRTERTLWQERRQARKAPDRMPKPQRANVPTTGKQRGLAILVTFPKTDYSEATTFSIDNPRQMFDNMLNQPGFDYDGATGSVRDYFLDASNGQYDLTFDVFGPVELSQDISFYGQNLSGGDLNAWNMVVEACEQLDDEIDFSQYDYNRDGIVDNIYIFYAGLGEANGGADYTVWQHAGHVEQLSGKQYVHDGVRLDRYACSNELRPILNPETGRNDNHLEGIGVVCHEFTHVLGFPDLYDVYGYGTFTPGPWSLMDVGPYNNNTHTPPTYSAYERMCMGWLTPEVLDGTARDIVLETVQTNQACRINTAQGDDEFFVLENRQQTGWDTYLPGHGMLIWHITYNKDLWDMNAPNSNDYCMGIDIVEADGIRTGETRDGDTFPGTAGVTAFTSQTSPALIDNNGTDINVPLTDITEKGGIITFKVSGGRPSLPTPGNVRTDDVTPVGFTARWEASPEATYYEVDVYRTGSEGREYVDGYRKRRVETMSVTVTGLQPETEYFLAVRARNSSAMSELSDAVAVTTPAISFAYTSPTALPATDIDATGFTAHWQTLEGATGYAIDVLTRSLTDGVVQTVDFSDGVKALPEGWTTNCKMTLSVAGAYGQAAPSLSMSADNNYLESGTFLDGLRSISLWYRERNAPCGRNSFTVDVLDPTKDVWHPLDTLNLTDTAPQSGTIISWISEEDEPSEAHTGLRAARIPMGSRAMRITYHRVGNGGLAVDDVVLHHGGETVYTPLPAWDRVDAGTELSCRVSGIDPTAHRYYYRIYGQDGDTFTLPSAPVEVSTSTGILLPTTSAKPEVWYDLTGRRVARPAHGIFISNRGVKRIFR